MTSESRARPAGPETGALFVTLFALGNILFQLPIGFVSDQMDRGKLLLSFGVFGLCEAIALAHAGPSHLVLFCGRLVVWRGGIGSLYDVGLGSIEIHRELMTAAAT